MPVINARCIPYIMATPSLNSDIIFSSSNLINLDLFDEKNYWIVEFDHVNAINYLEKSIPEYIIQATKSSKITLLLSNTNEGEYDVIDSIYKKVIVEWEIPEKNVVLVSEGADIATKISEFANKWQRLPIETWWSRLFEHHASWVIQPDRSPLLKFKNYDKKFLCFNRRPRPHRTKLLALLKIKNLFDKGYISTGNIPWTDCYSMLMSAQPELKNNKIGELLRLHGAEKFDIKQQTLDVEHDFNRKQLEIYHPRHVKTDEYYQNTYFSVVTETRCDRNGSRVISEKTFKPIINNHPFILVTVPHVLKLLREIGYRTFDGIIDESYDSESDDSTRLLMIVDEIERLSNLDNNQLQVFLEKTREICEHNYNHLLSLKNSSSFMTKTNRIF